jgi:predicted GIY-YIG superfamily endonuclease
MKGNLSDLLLRSLIGKQNAQKEIRDRLLPGFGCRCSKRGTISFFAMGRRRGVVRGSPIRITIGTYPVWSLADARTRARVLLRQLQGGIDPRAEKQNELVESIGQHAARKALTFLEQNLEPACYLYRHYHPNGDLLYVGISLVPLQRQDQHRKGATWRNMIWQIVIEPFATREEALTAEETAIRDEFPKFNSTHNNRRHPFQELARSSLNPQRPKPR